MKQFFFYAVLICLFFCSCKDGDKKSLPKPISPKAAYAMIHHYTDSAVSHSVDSLIRYIRFNNADVSALFSKDARITFWMAADTVTNQPTIIVEYDELPHSPDPDPVFFTMASLSLNLCPPPRTPPCDVGAMSEFSGLD